MRTYRLFDIKWDMDSFDDLSIILPPEVTVKIDDDDPFDPVEDSADYLSDNYGFCVHGCSFEEIT